MEQETKYAIPSKEIADQIWEDVQNMEYADKQSAESVVMKAVYFDSADQKLRRNNVAVRVRCEGESCFATLKWGGKAAVNGLHEREEINVPVDGDTCFIAPPVDMFRESEDGQKMMDLLEGDPLVNLFETRCLRRRIKLKYEDSIMELSIDEGHIVTDNGERPISELEVELFVGNIESIIDFSNLLAEKYGLKPEPLSKYARAMELIENK